jgi:hypothetical protein
MMNSGTVNRAIISNRSNALSELLETIPQDDELVTELYLRCFSRQPTKKELSAVRKYRKRSHNRREAFEDLAWSLVNSAEFQYRN